jgi:hypothetical protein
MELVKYQNIPAQGHPIGLVQMASVMALGDRALNFGRSRPSGIQVGKIPGYWTCPYNGTITGLYLNTDQGGYRIKFWKSVITTPVASDSINYQGVSIAEPFTHQEIFNLGDFIELDVVIGDTFAVEIVEVSGLHVPTDISGSLLFRQATEEKDK